MPNYGWNILAVCMVGLMGTNDESNRFQQATPYSQELIMCHNPRDGGASRIEESGLGQSAHTSPYSGLICCAPWMMESDIRHLRFRARQPGHNSFT